MNKATKAIVATLGTIFGLSGLNHGFFETLQGNIPTGGLFIAAIGEAQKMWPYGDESAFTLIPNFLITGIAAMLVGLAIVVWSLGFAQKKHGPAVLLLLFILLLLVGGGVAQILFFPWICLLATRIHKPLTWWRKVLPAGIRKPFGRIWPWLLAASTLLFAFALVTAVTGAIPGVNDPETVLAIMLSCLGVQVILLPLTFLSGFAHDIAARPDPVP